MATTEPLLITVKDAAEKLSLTPWSVYRLLDEKAIDSVYQGRRRYVVMASLHEYIESLPATQPDVASAS